MHPFDGAYFRVKWAEKRLLDLDRIIADFAKKEIEANGIDIEFKPGGRLEIILSQMGEPPQDISVLLGEVIYHLRSALDYMVYELAKSDSGKAQSGTQFPIDDTPEQFTRHRKTFLKGVSKAHADSIERLQLYNGSDWTHDLRQLSNPDKHRELIKALAVQDIQCQVLIIPPGQDAAGFPGKLHPIRNDPAARYAKVNQNVTSFSVSFGEGQPSVIELLKILQSQVAQTLDAFKPEIKSS